MSIPNLSAIAVKERSVTLFFLLLIIAGGIYAFLSLGRAEDPDFTVRVMMVSAQWPGATVETIEKQVADPIEKEIQNVRDIDAIETTIRPGVAYLKVEFEDFVTSEQLPDLFYEVRRRMQDVQPSLPAGVLGPQVNEDFSDVYFSLMSLTSEDRNQRELLSLTETLRDRLQQVKGVNKAHIFGEREQRVFVQFDTAKLQRLGTSTEQLMSQIQQFNALLPSGRLETAGPTVRIRLDNDLSDIERIKNLPLVINQRQLVLEDIATIERGFQDPPQQLIRAHGEGALVFIGFHAGMVVGIAIPVTLAATFMVMMAMGMNLDRITLGALIIALGLLVDDAIITIEMMLVKMEEGVDRVQAATHAWKVTAAPMLFGTLVTVSGFVPIGFAKSMVGEYAGNIFWVLAISLLLSWLVAVIFTPYVGVKLLPEIKPGTP